MVTTLLFAGPLFLPAARLRADPLPDGIPHTNPAAACRSAVALAEAQQAIPDHLLAAIARVESGRIDPTTQRTDPWPWTIDVGGEGHWFASEAEAIAAVRRLQAQGVRSIDVGCLQVNLEQHPAAFISLNEAFQPWANASYAAQFLHRLFDMTHDWRHAAGLYHSATPELGTPYEAQVMAAWPLERKAATVNLVPAHPVIGRDGMIVPSRRYSRARTARAGGFSEAAR